MLKKFTTKKRFKNDLEELIDKTSKRMLVLDPIKDKEEYNALLSNYEKLIKVQGEDQKTKVSKEALLGIAANLAGIGLILTHERLHTITSKAIGFVIKRRV